MNPSVPPTGSEPLRSQDSELIRNLREAGPGRRVFERFALERELGEGGMGVVWLALDEWLDRRPVALKFLARIISADTEALSDLRREIRHGLDINHPGIVRVYDLHEDRDEHLAAITMEYVDGKTLSELKVGRPDRCFDPAEILPWVRQLCETLDYLHRDAGVVHRDVKPRNIMFTTRGRLKLADFGIASAISESHSRLTQVSHGPTSGTPCYMSPQQIKGRSAKPADDIYALGITIFELLTGKPPFFRGPPAAILAQAEYDPAPTLADRRAEFGINSRSPIPPEWEETIAACLSKTPEGRPASAQDVYARLAAVVSAPPASTNNVASDCVTISDKPRSDASSPGFETKDEATVKAQASPPEAASARPSPAIHAQKVEIPAPAPAPAPVQPPVKESGRARWGWIGGAVLLIGAITGIAIWQWPPPPQKIHPATPRPAVIDPVDLLTQAKGKLAQNDPFGAFDLCRQAADAGNTAAQLMLAQMHAEGIGTARSPAKALDLYKRLAEAGNSDAQTHLGWMYANGVDVARDPATALNYYQQASVLGNAIAQNNLGSMLANGDGAPKDLPKAIELYRTALAHGEARAANNLGVMYRNGNGVEKSERTALELFTQGADLGDPAAEVNLAALYVEGRVTPKDETKAVSLLRSAAAAGNATAAYDLGLAFEKGFYGLTTDPATAAEFYQIAAAKGNARAQNNLAMMYAEGRGLTKDEARAVELLGRAADAGDAMAEYNFAHILETGAGIERNPQKAIDLYKRAAKDGDALAQCLLGRRYALGLGVAKNESLAVDYYRQAAESGYPPAMLSLASFYLSGFGGLPVSREKADEWRHRAYEGK
ncbi:MAG TPA: protein kinase [Chthoniobacteraceae bacterium]